MGGWGGGGVEGAVSRCQAEAAAAGLGGTTFRALLATGSASAASRLGPGDGWVRRDGIPLGVAFGAGGSLPRVPLNVTAAGAYVAGATWGGAPEPGDVGSGPWTCQDWLSSGGASAGRSGRTITGPRYFDQGGMASCNQTRILYCLEP